MRALQKTAFRYGLLLCLTATMAGCTVQRGLGELAPPDWLRQANHEAPVADGVAACRATLGRDQDLGSPALDSSAIRLVNWNTHKGTAPDWWSDLEPMLAETDLALLQEARLSDRLTSQPRGGRYFSFAPGYRSRAAATGVMTLSGTEPLARCNLTIREPWLRTPKATSITEFALTDSVETLVVVNVHVVNFAFGLKDFERQMIQVGEAVRAHRGPLILSGDFNTWRFARQRMLGEFADALDLQVVKYPDDRRLKVFGRPVDQVYVRDLEVVEASTGEVLTSDHNPMFVTLKL